MVAAESGAQHAVTGFYIRGYKYASYRKTVGQPFGYGYYVGPDAVMLERKIFTCTACSGLNFVEYEFDTCFFAFFLQ